MDKTELKTKPHIVDQTRKNVFKEVARLRREDSKHLLNAKRLNGAVYLMGYAIECHLKFAVCEHNNWSQLPRGKQTICGIQFPDLYTHNWDHLIEAAQLRRALKAQPRMEAIFSELTEAWGPKLRYQSKNVFALRRG